MNAKRVKALRKEALLMAVQNDLPYVAYSFKTYNKVYVDLLGKIKQYQVYTASMAPCQRKLYKDAKKAAKEFA